MQFNENQLEGLAKICDNLTTAAIVAAIGTGVLDHKIGWGAVVALLVSACFLLGFALYFRHLASQKEDEENGN